MKLLLIVCYYHFNTFKICNDILSYIPIMGLFFFPKSVNLDIYYFVHLFKEPVYGPINFALICLLFHQFLLWHLWFTWIYFVLFLASYCQALSQWFYIFSFSKIHNSSYKFPSKYCLGTFQQFWCEIFIIILFKISSLFFYRFLKVS